MNWLCSVTCSQGLSTPTPKHTPLGSYLSNTLMFKIPWNTKLSFSMCWVKYTSGPLWRLRKGMCVKGCFTFLWFIASTWFVHVYYVFVHPGLCKHFSDIKWSQMGRIWETLANSVHLDFLPLTPPSVLAYLKGGICIIWHPALYSSLYVPGTQCHFCLWNSPLPMLQLRTGSEPTPCSFWALCIWNKYSLEDSTQKAARGLLPPPWLWCSST